MRHDLDARVASAAKQTKDRTAAHKPGLCTRSEAARGLHDEAAQPRVRGVVLVLPVPPQRLDDRLLVARAFDYPEAHLRGEPDGEPFLHERDPVGAHNE